MITKIGIICGEILELLEKRNGILVYGEIQFDLKRPRDMVLMSLGWLLREGYVQILEDPFRNSYKDKAHVFSSEAFLFDLIVENRLAQCHTRVKDMPPHISAVADEILIFLEGCGDLTDIQTLERNLRAHRDVILMGLGWLVREGFVRTIAGNHEIFIFRLHKEPEDSHLRAFCLV
jgi:hypothetical protein